MNEERRKRWSGCYWWIALLLVSYVLSVGPVAKACFALEAAGYDLQFLDAPVGIFYSPLVWAGDHNEPFGSFLHWYLYDLWDIL